MAMLHVSTCPVCGQSMTSRRKDKTVCSHKCYMRAYRARARAALVPLLTNTDRANQLVAAEYIAAMFQQLKIQETNHVYSTQA